MIDSGPAATPRKRAFALHHPSQTKESSSSVSLLTEDYFSFLFGSSDNVGESKEIVGLKTISYLKLSSFIYSLTNVTSLAVPFVLKDTLFLSPAQLGLFSALCAVPSFLKPVGTLLIARNHRPFVLTTVGAIQTASYVAVGLAVTKGIATVPLICGAMFTHSMATSIGMVLRDSMMIESASRLGSDNAAHFLFSDVSMIQRIGLLPASYLSGYLLSYVSPGSLILGASIFPAIMTIAASFLDPFGETEQRETVTRELETAVERIRDKRTGFMSTTTGRGLLTCFVPSYTDAMFYFYTVDLGLSAEFLGRFQFMGSVAAILGNLVSRYSSDPRRLSNAANIFLLPLYGSVLVLTSHVPLGPIPVGAFILARHFLIDFFAALTTLPAAVQLMKSAPEGAEGTYLALAGTLGDAGNVFSSVLSSGVMTLYGIDGRNFQNLSDLVVLSLSGSASMLPTVLYYDNDEIQVGGPIRANRTTIEEIEFEEEGGLSGKFDDEVEEERSPRDA
jgi:hypothetical protein